MRHTKTWGAVAISAGAATAAIGLSGTAQADPSYTAPLVGVGSDTIQDVANAWGGFNNNISYSPVRSSAASGNKPLASFDAISPVDGTTDCIATKLKGASINRPNGSSKGRAALSRAIDGTGWGSTLCGTGPKPVGSLVDFARSSSGPSGSGTQLTYIPIGRDGVSAAVYRANGAPVTSFTRDQLVALFTTGAQTIGGVRVVPCGIQEGSGTFSFWNGITTAVAGGNEVTATAECNALLPTDGGGTGRAQENDGLDLKNRGDALAALAGHNGDQVIIGFSAAAFIAKSNGVTDGAPPAGVTMASITDATIGGGGANLGSPVVGSAPTMTPSSTFYANSTFGRNVYVVVSTAKIDSAFGNDDLKSMFKNTATLPANNAAICQPSVLTTTQAFGFLTDTATCGSTTLKGPLVSGQS